MLDRGVTGEHPNAANGETSCNQPDNRPDSLEARICRLEDAVAGLHDTQHLEERVCERVYTRMKREPAAPAPAAPVAPTAAIANTGRQLLPAALTLIRAETEHAERHSQRAGAEVRRPWFLFDFYAEVRAMVRMFMDRRYRVSWSARVLPAVLAVLILTSWIWFPGTSILPSSLMTIIIKIVDVGLAFVAFKILTREVRCYREVIPDVASPPRP